MAATCCLHLSPMHSQAAALSPTPAPCLPRLAFHFPLLMSEDEYRGSMAQRLMRVDAMEAAAAQGMREAAAAAESKQDLVQEGLALMLPVALLRFVVQLPLTVVLFKAVTSDFVVGVAAAGLDATGWLALGCWAVWAKWVWDGTLGLVDAAARFHFARRLNALP